MQLRKRFGYQNMFQHVPGITWDNQRNVANVNKPNQRSLDNIITVMFTNPKSTETGNCSRRIYWRGNSKLFYLQNTGSIAIKLKPAALTQIFGFSMDRYLDKIVDLDSLPNAELIQLEARAICEETSG